MKTMVALNRDDVNDLQYPVVVEMWKHIEAGKGRRAYLAEFDERERARVRLWYKAFYGWYLRTGVPQSVVMSPHTLLWLRTKVVPFFANL